MPVNHFISIMKTQWPGNKTKFPLQPTKLTITWHWLSWSHWCLVLCIYQTASFLSHRSQFLDLAPPKNVFLTNINILLSVTLLYQPLRHLCSLGCVVSGMRKKRKSHSSDTGTVGSIVQLQYCTGALCSCTQTPLVFISHIANDHSLKEAKYQEGRLHWGNVCWHVCEWPGWPWKTDRMDALSLKAQEC